MLSFKVVVFCDKKCTSFLPERFKGQLKKEQSFSIRFSPVFHLPPIRPIRKSQDKTLAAFPLKSPGHGHPSTHTHTYKRGVPQAFWFEMRTRTYLGLEGFPMNCPRTIFFIFFLGNPHFLKGVQGGQDGTTVKWPNIELSQITRRTGFSSFLYGLYLSNDFPSAAWMHPRTYKHCHC